MNNAMETIRQAHETKAIKQHVCDFCSQKIQIGETYFSSTHTHDGTIYDWKTHKGCNFIANKLDMYDNCDDGLTGDDFMEIIKEEHYSLMIKFFPKDAEDQKCWAVVLSQLRSVTFREMLRYVIRHYSTPSTTNKTT